MFSTIKEFIVNVLPGPFVRLFASPYVAGLGMDAGIDTAEKLWREKSIYTTLDLLGEAVHTRELVERNVNYYLDLIELIEKRKATDHITISLKLTSLGIHESKEYCIENLEKILARADQAGIPVTIDMEDSPYTDVTLEIYKELLSSHPTLGTVLQTRLYRTEKDIEELPPNSRIRLVIGIYKEPPEIAYTDKKIMHERLVEFSKTLLEKGVYTEVGTHNNYSIHQVLNFLEEQKRQGKDYKDKVEFQMLLGVPREKTQRTIQKKGYKVRLYVPFAMDWGDGVAYLKRRMIENPNMVGYVLKNLLASKKVQALLGLLGIGILIYAGWYYF